MTDTPPEPTWIDDQVTAAAEHARSIFARQPLAEGRYEFDEALQERIRQHVRTLLPGSGRRCVHLDAPRPFVTAVWRPGVLVCVPCSRAGVLDCNEHPCPGHTCNMCEQYPAGGELSMISHQMGAQLTYFVLCPSCETTHTKTVDAAGDSG